MWPGDYAQAQHKQCTHDFMSGAFASLEFCAEPLSVIAHAMDGLWHPAAVHPAAAVRVSSCAVRAAPEIKNAWNRICSGQL
jgi:hypothetical protein